MHRPARLPCMNRRANRLNANRPNANRPGRFLLKMGLPGLLLALLTLVALCGCSPAVRGSLALSRGDNDQALALYHEALRQEPDSVPLRLRIGHTYMAMGAYDQAEAIFHNALLLQPGQPEALFYLGLSRIGKGEAKAALTELSIYEWDGKFLISRAVRDEAARLLGHPELPPKALMASLKDALEQGRKEQDEMERDMFLGVGR